MKQSISELCELWFLQDRDGREALVAQTITFLLIKALEPDAKLTYLNRLYKFRTALELLDLDDTSSVAIREVLQAVAIHPFFLVNDAGKKFVAYLFSLNLALIDQLHVTIQSSFLNSREWMVEACAAIYFKVNSPVYHTKQQAWKLSEGPFRIRIEHNCIQDFIKQAIHLKDSRLVKNAQIVLKYFQTQKLQFKHIDAMLARLYEPILWRSLQVANSFVRRNAVTQFALAFPLV